VVVVVVENDFDGAWLVGVQSHSSVKIPSGRCTHENSVGRPPREKSAGQCAKN